MGSWAAVLVDATGTIIARGVAVRVGPLPMRSLRVTVASELAIDALALGQPVSVRSSPRKVYMGVVEACGTNSAGAHTLTIALDRR
jgi:outer membrane PBP1 activator LpoA protein